MESDILKTRKGYFSRFFVPDENTARHSKKIFLYAASLSLVLTLIWIVYSPGLTGGFVFDDKNNFSVIKSQKKIDSIGSLVGYLNSADAGPLKRPVSMLSFLIDDRFWPLDTYRIKRTNVLIHMVNTCLVIWLAYLLLLRLLPAKREHEIIMFSICTGLMWSINPMQVSTVSYMIQRMAQLSALFSLLGIIVYMKFHEAYFKKALASMKTMIVFGFLFGLVFMLGILSKENAVMMSLLTYITIKCTTKIPAIPQKESRKESRKESEQAPEKENQSKQRQLWYLGEWVLLILPMILLLVYTVYKYIILGSDYDYREFTIIERLLTQARIFFIYLTSIFIPDVTQMGMFRGGQIELSTSLFKPLTTVFSLLGLMTIVFLVAKFKAKRPLFVFGPIFFIAGHLLESSFIPIEMYFEHRNYLPQVGLWISVVGVLASIVNKKRVAVILLLSSAAIYSLLAFRLAIWWGTPLMLEKKWYDADVSVRSTQGYAIALTHLGRSDEAMGIIENGLTAFPNSLSLNLTFDLLVCNQASNLEPFPVVKYAKIATLTPPEIGWIEVVRTMFDQFKKGDACPGIDDNALLFILQHVIENNEKMLARDALAGNIYHLLYEIYQWQGNLDKSMGYLNLACEISCGPNVRFQQAVILASAGLYQEALVYLELTRGELTFVNRIIYPDLEQKVHFSEINLRQALEQ